MSSKENLLASAQKNLQKGQIAKAIKDYQQVVEQDPKDIRNRQKLAELYCRARMNAEALGEYGAVARYYADNGFNLKAIAVYKQMQRLDPEQANVCHRLAELNIKQGLVGNALAEYRNLAELFEKKKLLADAIGVLQKMAELEPENLNIHVRIAEFYAQTGLRDKAWAELSQILDQLREARDFTRVAKLYEMFQPLFPNDPKMKIGFAEALVRKGEVEKGLQMLKVLLRDSPENSQILKALAFGYREKEDYENERLTYQHLLKQAPGNLELREGYIRACLDGGEHRRALEELNEWKDVFIAGGQVSLLKAFYKDLLKVFPGNEQVLAALSLVGDQAGKDEKIPDTVTVCQPLAEISPAPEFAVSETVFVEIAEPASVEAAAPAREPDPGAVQSQSDAESGGAEEIPLEFLETTAELAAPSSAKPLADVSKGLLQAAICPETIADELELELELELDEPLLGLAIQQDELILDDRRGAAHEESVALSGVAWAGEGDVSALAEENLEELDPEEILEELEELEPEELFDELELISDQEPLKTHAAEAAEDAKTASECLGSELRDLLSGLESLPNPAMNARGELEEAEFYLQQGLFDDAERICKQLLCVDPGCAEAQEKLAELATLRQEAVIAPAEHQLFDLPVASRNNEGWQGHAVMSGLDEVDHLGLDGIVDDFKMNVETQIDAEDTETHYNLGIAYKEMGLFDDAVAEFDKAMKNPGRLVDSLTLKGTCLFEKGAFDLAEEVFKSGLVYQGLNAAERISLHYEMGLLYEAWGRPLEALDSFQSAADADLFFRNVGEKIEALRKILGLDANTGKEDPGGRGSRSRVSYI
ncbi:MAG TPA: tetratricopeptide repeat protein [Desulfuromonadales bacterium]|nr:tetratricopeptide repeat protein [Desulfuromonadales bacterium]